MKALFTTTEAAEYLGYSPGTIGASRKTGILAGIAAPKHIKLGDNNKSHVRYEQVELDAWIDRARQPSKSEQ